MFLIFFIAMIVILKIAVQLKKTIDNAKAARQIDINADYERMRKINSICNQQ
jgi:hypothetical protein